MRQPLFSKGRWVLHKKGSGGNSVPVLLQNILDFACYRSMLFKKTFAFIGHLDGAIDLQVLECHSVRVMLIGCQQKIEMVADRCKDGRVMVMEAK